MLPIQRFTGEMKLSRTPVREAILRLQREGFVEVRPRLGTIVAHLDLRRLRAMYHVRSVLEGDAARLACEIIPEQVLSTCDKELRRQRTSGTLDVAAMSEAAQHLHEAIIAHCGNMVLMETIRGLQDHFVRFRHVSSLKSVSISAVSVLGCIPELSLRIHSRHHRQQLPTIRSNLNTEKNWVTRTGCG